MPALQFGLSSYERAEGDIAELPLVNLYAEQTAPEGIVVQSRRGLVERGADMGAGPVRALFKRDGVVGGRLLGVSGGSLYDVTTSKGLVFGTGPVSIAGNETGVLVCAGSSLHSYNGTAFATVSFPDSAPVIKVIEAQSRFLAIRGNSGVFYFTPPLAQTFDPLDFATAESSADRLLDALYVNDILFLFGAETVEPWTPTGNNDLPFAPIQAAVMERGIRATGCATALGSSFAWVTDVNTVCLQNESNIISNPGLQARIAASATCSVFTFFLDGVEFLAVRLDHETQCYNTQTGTWSEFASYGQTNWLASCFAGDVFGSGIDGKTLAFGSGYEELGGVLERRFRAGVPIDGTGFRVNHLHLRVNPGKTPFLAGDYADPVVEMRLSPDAGQTWGERLPASLGMQGNYRPRVEWRALGLASQPAFLAEFRVTDPVAFRCSGVFINEGLMGR